MKNSTTEENKPAKKAPAKKATAKKATAKKAPAKKLTATKKNAEKNSAKPTDLETTNNLSKDNTVVGEEKKKKELINNKDWELIFDSTKSINLNDYTQVKQVGHRKLLVRNITTMDNNVIHSNIILIEGIGITTEKDNKNNVTCRKFF